MNVKQWIALLILYVGYLLMGAMVFYYLEKDNETVKRNEDFKLYKDLMGNGPPICDDILPSLILLYNFLYFYCTIPG